ncbi:MAG: GNAT family acetyltransferase [Deltaproteobacteria bacterium]|nr:GNAT family acetyltransferase [Deltaproteobacteria bacterium]
MEIRPYREADGASVVALWRRCDLVVAWNDPLQDIDRKLQVQRQLFLVAEHQGQIVGTVMAGYDGHRGWINYLATAPDHQRKGIGRALMSVAEDGLRALGCPKVNLQVRRWNSNAVGFYEHIGYAVEDNVSMGKRLR